MGMRVLPPDHPMQNPLLDSTPIGRLRVVEWAGTFCVARMNSHDPTKIKTVIHTLKPGENPLNAIYGKRMLEDGPAAAAYKKRDECKTESLQSVDADIRKDFRRELTKVLNKEDGRDAVGWMFTHKGQGRTSRPPLVN